MNPPVVSEMPSSQDALANSSLKVDPSCYVDKEVDCVARDTADCMDELGLRLDDDGYIKWRIDSPDHPRNWSVSRKAFDTTLIFMLDLFTYVTWCLINFESLKYLLLGPPLVQQEYVQQMKCVRNSATNTHSPRSQKLRKRSMV